MKKVLTLLEEYKTENGLTFRSTSDLSPLEIWLLEKCIALKERCEGDTKSDTGSGLHIADVSKSACLCEISDRYWDKNGSKCLKCGKHFS